MSGSVPYIGSRMSLISKAEIRYEGFLHEIDTNNTTVTLKNVRSFGTENRRTDKVIPPKDDVFQYIIFRGTDIKDISVCEAAAFTDPAIVQSGPPAAANARPQGQSVGQAPVGSAITPDTVSPTPASFPPFAMPAPNQTKSHPPAVPSPQLFRDSPVAPESQISPEPLIDQSRQLNSVTEQNAIRVNNQMRQQAPPPRQNQNSGFRNETRSNDHRNDNRSYSATARQGQPQYPRNYQDYPRSYAYNSSGNPYNNSYGSGGGGNTYNRNNPIAATPLMGNNNNNNNNTRERGFNNYQNNNYRWNQNNGPNGRRMGQRNSNHDNQQSGPGTGDLKIDEEFDIDDANRKFDKSQLVREFANMNVQDQGQAENEQVQTLADLEEGEINEELRNTEACKFYDKTKSFFDSISCDALEKRTSRLTTAEEKKLNYQTFGTPAINRNRPNGPNNYNNGGPGFRPRSAGNFGGAPHDNYRRGGNYYGGFNNSSNYRRGPNGANSYYTSNYPAGQGNRQQYQYQNNYRQRQNFTGNNNSSAVGAPNRLSNPTQA